MNTNIFVPKKINVGFQNRKDTYSGKLAYVIYFDEKGKLRKETSWNSWRDENIPNEIYDNEPTEGFVLNKKVGGVEECWGWDPRKTYTRVYDPRGFEFEITIPNLLWILENCNCIKGKGLEGEFVYGWDGKELLLVPVDSADYKEIERKNKIFHSNDFIKAKDLKVGATYLSKIDQTYIYMGKFDEYVYGYWKNECFFESYRKMAKYCEENNIQKVNLNNGGYWSNYRYQEDKQDYGTIGKKHCFYHTYKDCEGNERGVFEWRSSISKWLINVIDDKCHDNYAEYFDLLEHQPKYSPPDENKVTYHRETLEEFSKRIKTSDNRYYCNASFYSNVNGNIERFEARRYNYGDNEYVLYKYEPNVWYADIEVLNLFPTKEKEEVQYYYPKQTKKVLHMIPVTFEEIFNRMRPMYKQIYLANGKTYEKRYK